jgi:hypothetical protein
MTSARVRDPRADHLLTPQNAALLPIDYQPSSAGQPERLAAVLLLSTGRSQERGERAPPSSRPIAADLSTVVLMPGFGPKPLVAFGMLAAAGGTAWLGQHTGYATGVLGPLILAGVGLGMVIATAINTGTFGVAPPDAGVAAATVTVGQMLGGSVGTFC